MSLVSVRFVMHFPLIYETRQVDLLSCEGTGVLDRDMSHGSLRFPFQSRFKSFDGNIGRNAGDRIVVRMFVEHCN
jgi:hypothetical protein